MSSDSDNNYISFFDQATEFLVFAEWAFGPDGLLVLQALAFGDFSLDERYPGQQFLVRRKDLLENCSGDASERLFDDLPSCLPFCPVSMTDPLTWDGVSLDGPRLITACPGGSLIESPYEI
ncbi:hypothetical protein NUU61_001447 [Penicillium alfredii]|uniref:Uncharacterized protein n=1 Tax=Penicillium alfredii TaxID=1506179 RepID=A0A9W9G5S0_9EURO|nr:uncharacterized protein NUU61_001447 [Penicillium alfredii]KAJ5111817.1 hypothetical protein NUU61_001447 [Penicillium alfredii]